MTSSNVSMIIPDSDSSLFFPTEVVIPSFSHLYLQWLDLHTASIFAFRHVKGFFCDPASSVGWVPPCCLLCFKVLICFCINNTPFLATDLPGLMLPAHSTDPTLLSDTRAFLQLSYSRTGS